MQHETVTYLRVGGWQSPLPAALDGPQTVVIAFAAPELVLHDEPFAELAAAFPRSVVLGCSTAGEIDGARVHDMSIRVAVARFEHTGLRQAMTPIAGAADSAAAGERLAAQLRGDDLRAVFILAEGLNVNGTPLVAALAAGLEPGVCITGGLAADGGRFVSTWVLDGGKRSSKHVSAVGFYGRRFVVGSGCHAGWLDFGPERRITRAAGNVLYELDGKPALDLYKMYLGDRARALPGSALLFPLGVRRSHDDTETLVRTVLKIDETSKSLTFAGDLPAGGIARLMRANSDQLISGAGVAAREAISAVTAIAPLSDALAISVSCVGRRLVLGERADEEVETILDGTPARTSHVGFYSYGEIAPGAAGGASGLHNQTMTVTLLGEV